VTCPWHGWQFNVRTGECLDRPDRPVALHPVRLEEGRILVDPGRPAQPSGPGGALGA
jgi:nitrite reductase/ring-hydroxylating ferredoxin subunit